LRLGWRASSSESRVHAAALGAASAPQGRRCGPQPPPVPRSLPSLCGLPARGRAALQPRDLRGNGAAGGMPNAIQIGDEQVETNTMVGRQRRALGFGTSLRSVALAKGEEDASPAGIAGRGDPLPRYLHAEGVQRDAPTPTAIARRGQGRVGPRICGALPGTLPPGDVRPAR